MRDRFGGYARRSTWIAVRDLGGFAGRGLLGQVTACEILNLVIRPKRRQ